MKSLVYNTDCVQGMKLVPDKFFDLAVVDPPYGINAPNMNMGSHPTRSRNDGHGSGPGISTTQKMKGRLNQGGGKLKNRTLNKSEFDWDNETPDAEYWQELFRVSKNQVIWGGNYFPLPPTRCMLCWDKMQPWDNFSQFELAWTSFDKPAALFRHSNTGGNNAEAKIHPTQKPVKLYEWIFSKFSQPGMKVLDTHLGSGSSRIAAHAYNLDFYGYEINKEYFTMQEKRFLAHSSQLLLF